MPYCQGRGGWGQGTGRCIPELAAYRLQLDWEHILQLLGSGKSRESPRGLQLSTNTTQKTIPEVHYHCSYKISFLFSFSVACSQSSGQIPYPNFSRIALIYVYFFFLFCARYASIPYLLHSLPAQTGVRFPVKPF